MMTSAQNPILVEFRQLRGADWVRPERYGAQVAMYLRWLAHPDFDKASDTPATAEQVEHASKVLTRLAALA